MTTKIANVLSSDTGQIATLAAPIAGTGTSSITTSAAAPSDLQGGSFTIRIGNELLLVTSGQDTTTWAVDRGVEGSSAATHTSGSSIRHILTAGSLLSVTSARGLPSNVEVRTTSYTAAVGDLALMDATDGDVIVTLPSTPAVGALVTVKKSDSSANTVTADASGGMNIDGNSAGVTLTRQHEVVIVEHIGSNSWKRVSHSLSAQSGHTIEDEGTPLPARSKLNFTGVGVIVTDNAGADSSDVSITGAGVSDASTTVKGVTKLATAPVSASAPIAVGDNDPRVTADQAAATASIRTLGSGSAQAAAGDHTHTGLTAQAAGTPSVRAIGATGTTVIAGNDSRLSDSRTPAGAAGGVLGGTYPNPTFAADMATQAELDAAIAGKTSGHAIQDEGSALTQRAAVNFVGAGVQAIDDAGNGATKVTISGQLYSAVTDTPEAHGAKRDGKQIRNCSMTSGANVLTCTDAPFVSGDVGKVVHVRGAAGTNIGLTATISAFTDASHVTLSANASATVASQVATYGTDDTAAWVAALAAAVAACQADGSNYAEIVGSNGIYMIAGATTKGGGSPDTKGNAQIPIPVIDPRVAGSQKVVLRLGGAHDSAVVSHWDQTVPQKSGCVLFSTLTGQVSDGTYGAPSVLGGPTVNINATGPEVFSNMKVILDGISVVAPFNPSIMGVDLRRIAQADVLNLSCLSDATPDTDGPNPTNITKPTNSLGVGLYMPRFNNNDSANIGVYHCEGFYYGLGFSDHMTAQKLLIVYFNTAFFISDGGNSIGSTGVHGAAILYASVEAGGTVIQVNASAGAKMPLHIALLDTEIVGTGGTVSDIIDSNSALRGYIGWADNSLRDPKVTGAANLKIDNVMVTRTVLGAGTTPAAPAVPATTVATAAGTGLIFHDAAVTITAGAGSTCAVSIDGQAVGTLPASGVGTFVVPSGKSITLTYTSAPTWAWTLL